MGLLNPLHGLLIPSFFLLTIPLALLATFTTALAFSVLLLRVLIVYLDMLFSLIPSRRPRSLPRPPSSPTLTSPTPRKTTSTHHRRRRSSASALSASSSFSERSLGLVPSIGAERDYEGIGGWRVGGGQLDDELWTTVNPKLERHHHRSPSGGGPTTPGEGGMLMMKTRSPRTSETTPIGRTSPNSSRARTPTGPRGLTGMSGEPSGGYFALSRNTSPKAAKTYHGHGAE